MLLVVVGGADPLDRLDGAQQRDAAARQNAFLDRGAGCVHRVVNAILALLHLDLGGAADADHRDAARELRKALLEFLAIIVGGGLLDLRLDLGDTSLDVDLLAGAVDDRGVLLLDHHLLGAAQHGDRDILQLDAEIFRDCLPAGQDRNVLQHRLAAIAEARRLDGRDLEAAAQLVDDQGSERLALNVLGHDDQRLAGLHHSFEQRQQLLEARQLLLIYQDVGVLHLDAHLVCVGDEVGRDVAAVELHALDHVELGLQRLRLLDRDDALVADLLHRLGEEAADFGVAIGRDGADLGDLIVRGDLLGVGLQVLHDRLDGEVNAALEVHRVHAGGDRLGTFLHDRLGQHGRGGGAVASEVGGLARDFAHHLGAHVLELVLKLDFLGDRHAVLGDARRAKRLVQHDIAALGPERHSHRIGENIDAAQHLLAGVTRKFYFLSSHVSLLLKDVLPYLRQAHLAKPLWPNQRGRYVRPLSDQRMGRNVDCLSRKSGGLLLGLGFLENPHDVAFLHDEVLDAIDLDLGARPFAEQDAVADLHIQRNQFARLVAATRPYGDDFPLGRFLFGGVRDDDAAGALLLGIDALDDDAVVKRTKLHAVLLSD